MLPADLRHRHLAAQRRKHQLELLRRRELAVLPGLAQLDSPSVERPILRGAPDAIVASALRTFGSDRVRANLTRTLSTPQMGADQGRQHRSDHPQPAETPVSERT